MSVFCKQPIESGIGLLLRYSKINNLTDRVEIIIFRKLNSRKKKLFYTYRIAPYP